MGETVRRLGTRTNSHSRAYLGGTFFYLFRPVRETGHSEGGLARTTGEQLLLFSVHLNLFMYNLTMASIAGQNSVNLIMSQVNR